jgi:hypothetical protein
LNRPAFGKPKIEKPIPIRQIKQLGSQFIQLCFDVNWHGSFSKITARNNEIYTPVLIV